MAVRSPEHKSRPVDWRTVDPPQLSTLLAVALDLFHEKGFHGTSVREILSRADVTAPTLYYHHKNKEGILLDLLEYSTNDLLARISAAKLDAGDDPVQQLSNAIVAIVLPMTIRSRLSALEGEVRYLAPEHRQRYRRARKDVERVVLGIVEDGTSRGDFHVVDAFETTRAVLAMCQAIPRWYRSDGELTPEDVARKYVQIALSTVRSVSSAEQGSE